jgi:magnesium chelatase accessory protein
MPSPANSPNAGTVVARRSDSVAVPARVTVSSNTGRPGGSRRAAFEAEGRDWPNRNFSRFVEAAGLDWHVQQMGQGPDLLLVHGTGASTHSWRDMAPLLATRFRVVVPDLPGHGFTATAPANESTLPGMARALSDLLQVLEVDPAIVVGHSAGAAVLVRMTLDGLIAPESMISINGALLPLTGIPRWIFAPLAKLLTQIPLVPRLAASRAARAGAVEKLIADTGSRLDRTGIDLYQRLVRKPDHVAGALSMMASWDLVPLARDLVKLRTPLQLLTASGDRTILPADAERVCALTACARIGSLGQLGHLAHEERPRIVAHEIIRFSVQAGVLHGA